MGTGGPIFEPRLTCFLCLSPPLVVCHYSEYTGLARTRARGTDGGIVGARATVGKRVEEVGAEGYVQGGGSGTQARQAKMCKAEAFEEEVVEGRREAQRAGGL